ncbi:MAG: ABC transporter permease [Verrucomicrobia bacterium]|nr:ABC transporter permease [Verrucomicrobiota bacterium]
MNPTPVPLTFRLLQAATPLLFLMVVLVFGLLEPRFFSFSNLQGILLQSTATALVAVGMTFVLLVAGVDLSVGALMFVGAALAGKLILAGQPVALALAVMLAVGVVGGTVNALLVTRLRLIAFVATLGLLHVGRGLGLWITQTRAMNLPDSFLQLGSAQWLGLPLPLWLLSVVVLAAWTLLNRTPFGRHLYATGFSEEAARKAGLPTRRIIGLAYVLCGACAGLGGMVALAQLGAVSPSFGEYYEFEAITACVLGGISLFGGRGQVFPGPILGAVLVKSLFNGLVMIQADPYLFPVITGAVIFFAVGVDSLRARWLQRWNQRPIYLTDPV